MVDLLHHIVAVQVIPAIRLVGVQFGPGSNVVTDVGQGRAFRLECGRQHEPVPLAGHDNDLALAVLVLGEPTVSPVLFMVGGLHVAAEVGPVDLDRLALAAELVSLDLGGHRLAQLVGQHEGRLVLHAEVTGQHQGGLALDLVAEDHGCRQVVLQGQLVEGEQGAAGQAEILAAGFAAKPQRAIGAAALVADRAAAAWAYGLAVRLRPAHGGKALLGLRVRHPQHGREAQGAGLGGEEKVAGHCHRPRY